MLEQFYQKAPASLQQIMVAARGLHYEQVRNDAREQIRFLEFLRHSQWWDAERFRNYQLGRLRQLLTSAVATIPYYQELARGTGWSPEELRTLEDLRELPVLEKQALRGRESLFQKPGWRPLRRTKVFSSGTTGTPIRTVECRKSWAHRWAFVARLRDWAGIRNPIRPRRASFTGRNIVPPGSEPPFSPPWRMNPAGNQLLLSTVHLASGTVPRYVEGLERFQPEIIEGYPSAIRILGKLARATGLSLPSPRAIVTTAETLLPEARADIERDYGAKVFDQYSASEPSCFWSECEHGTLHENPEYGISEILRDDGTEAGPLEMGSVVVTSFLNPIMPLVRYRLGDVAIRAFPTACGCGRQMPVIAKVVGRLDDVIFVPERGYVGRLDPAFKGLHGIIETQVVQTALEAFEILLVPDTTYREDVGKRLIANLREKLGTAATIEIHIVPRVPRGPNGKFRSVISRVRHLYPDANEQVPGSGSRGPAGQLTG